MTKNSQKGNLRVEMTQFFFRLVSSKLKFAEFIVKYGSLKIAMITDHASSKISR